jgi:hypothetical protein
MEKEFIEVMRKSCAEIRMLRSEIERLKPKAEAYDMLVPIIRQLPQPSYGQSEDLVWELERRIDRMEKPEQDAAS